MVTDISDEPTKDVANNKAVIQNRAASQEDDLFDK